MGSGWGGWCDTCWVLWEGRRDVVELLLVWWFWGRWWVSRVWCIRIRFRVHNVGLVIIVFGARELVDAGWHAIPVSVAVLRPP